MVMAMKKFWEVFVVVFKTSLLLFVVFLSFFVATISIIATYKGGGVLGLITYFSITGK